MQVGLRGEHAVQVRIDNPAARCNGSIVPEIVRGFENEPGHIHRERIRLRLVGKLCRGVRAPLCRMRLRSLPISPQSVRDR